MTQRKPKVGLLPLYLKLYDEIRPEWRGPLGAFADQVAGKLSAAGFEVVRSEFCRLAPEFDAAVVAFERAGVDGIATLHLAYSPSLEAVDALSRTKLPILILDTTMDRDFGAGVNPERIGFNHGVHGVMDLASVLRRRGRAFRIVAGHAEDAALWSRAAAELGAAAAARRFRGMRLLRVGEVFKGMGDFQVEPEAMRAKLGLSVDQIEPRDLGAEAARVTSAEIKAEMELDRRSFDCAGLPADCHQRAVRTGLALRKRLESGNYGGFSMHFGAFAGCEQAGIEAVPFLEASKAMARGVGYGGEGDVLTAALVGALQCGFGRTTFTEIFCPDWAGGSLFLSHMGEINPEVAAAKPLVYENASPYTGTKPVATLTCAPAPGPAVFVNLAPGPDDGFAVLASAVEVLGDSSRADMKKSVRGWIRPDRPLGEFLEAYSRAGGTHHSALVLGQEPEAIAAFAAFAGLGFERI
jgi:L-arabinose isomerase